MKSSLVDPFRHRQHHARAHVLRPEARLAIAQCGVDKFDFVHDVCCFEKEAEYSSSLPSSQWIFTSPLR